jgi:hypothetical protein
MDFRPQISEENMWTTPLLPNGWLTTLAGTTSSFGLQIMPIVLILCGIFLAFIIIRFIISLVRPSRITFTKSQWEELSADEQTAMELEDAVDITEGDDDEF